MAASLEEVVMTTSLFLPYMLLGGLGASGTTQLIAPLKFLCLITDVKRLKLYKVSLLLVRKCLA